MAQVSIEKLIKNYLTAVVFCSEHFNMSYYLHLTSSKSKVEESWKKITEGHGYDNDRSQSFISKVDQSYENLKPYIDEGNLKVSKNILELVKEAIRFLKEDIENVEKLSQVVLNKEEIISFSNINIQRLVFLLKTIDVVE